MEQKYDQQFQVVFDAIKSGLELMLVFPCEREGKQFS
jgi:hypothetical protein